MGNLMVSMEITDQELRLLWFSLKCGLKKDKSLTVVRFDCIPLAAGVIEQGYVRNEKALIDLLRSQRDSWGERRKIQACLALAFNNGFIRQYSLPWIAQRERNQAIEFLVDEEVPIPAPERIFDFYVMHEDKKDNFFQLMLAASRAQVIERLVVCLETAGYEVVRVNFVALALAQVLDLKVGEEVLYLQDNNDSLLLILYRGIIPEVIRTTYFKDSLSQEGEWETEIQRLLLYYGAQKENFSLNRILVSGGGKAREIASILHKTGLARNVQPVALEAFNLSWPGRKLLQVETQKCLAALGLALEWPGKGINLWRKNLVEKKNRKIGFISAAVFLVFMFSLIFSSILLHSREFVLGKEVNAVRAYVLDMEKDLRAQEELKKNWLDVLQKKEKVSSHLTKVQNLAIPELVIKQLDYKQGALSIRGAAAGSDAVEQIMRQLRELGWEKPQLGSYRQNESGFIEFNLTVIKSSKI